MKIEKLFQCNINPFAPPKLCGAEVGIGALIGGIASGAGAVGSALIGSSSAEDSVSTNVRENAKNREFNREEAQKNRDFQSREALLARQWQSSEWNWQFQNQNEEWYKQTNYANQQAYNYWLQQQNYNSLAEQAQRAKAAGFNPSAVLGNSTYGSTGLAAAPTGVGSPSVPMPSTPSGSQASISTSNPAAAVNKADVIGNLISSVTGAFANLAKAGKDGVETERMIGTLKSFIQEQAGKAHNIELINNYQDIMNYVASQTKDKQIQKLGVEIEKTLSEIFLNRENASYFAERSATERLNQVLVDNAGKIKFEELLQLQARTQVIGQILDNEVELGRQKIKTEQSVQSNQYAQSMLHVAQSKTENELRPLRKEYQELTNVVTELQGKGLAWDNLYKDNTFRARVHSVLEQAKQQGFITEKERAAAAQALYNYNIRYLNTVLSSIGSAAGAYRDVGVGTRQLRESAPPMIAKPEAPLDLWSIDSTY